MIDGNDGVFEDNVFPPTDDEDPEKMRDFNLDEIVRERRRSRFHDEDRHCADEKSVGGDSISLGEREISNSVFVDQNITYSLPNG